LEERNDDRSEHGVDIIMHCSSGLVVSHDIRIREALRIIWLADETQDPGTFQGVVPSVMAKNLYSFPHSAFCRKCSHVHIDFSREKDVSLMRGDH
jgi:hypothetical protein